MFRVQTFTKCHFPKNIAGINFHEWSLNHVFAGINFRERAKKSRKFIPAKLNPFKVMDNFAKRAIFHVFTAFS